MNFLKTIKLNTRIVLYISTIIIISYAILGVFMYSTQRNRIIDDVNANLHLQVNNLTQLITTHISEKEEKAHAYMKFLNYYYNILNIITESDTIFKTKNIQKLFSEDYVNIQFPEWTINGKKVQGDHSFVDFIKEDSEVTATVFQKTDKGYLPIATNLFINNERAIKVLVPDTMAMILAIENGETYINRVSVLDTWYRTIYKPIYIDKKINGMLYVGIIEKDKAQLHNIFNEIKYLETGYPFLVDEAGKLIIHPNLNGSDLSKTEFYRHLQIANENKEIMFRYRWPETENGKWKWVHFRYLKSIDSYICSSVYETELLQGLERLKYTILIAVFVVVLFFIFAISYFSKSLLKEIDSIVLATTRLAQGDLSEKIEIERYDEIGNIARSVNLLIDNWHATAEFARKIGDGQFSVQFSPLSEKDILGNSLIDMRLSLQKARQAEEDRRNEARQLSWINEGIAKVNEIIRQNNNINTLADKILQEIIKFTETNQGAIFMLDNSEKEEVLQMVSIYAHNRKKFINKKITLGEGLVGTCAMEKDRILLTEIPDNYINIASGLGQAKPKCLLFEPLIIDENLHGVIEIASFDYIEDHKITFIERIASSLAATFASAKIARNTTALLEKSNKHSKNLIQKELQMEETIQKLENFRDEASTREQDLTGILQAINSVFFVVNLDMDAIILDVSNSYLDFFEISRDQFIGKNHREFTVRRTTEEEYLEFWRRLQQGEVISDIQYVELSNHRNYWLSENYIPILDKNGVPYKILNIAFDLTELKEKEIQVRDLSEKLEEKQTVLNKQILELKNESNTLELNDIEAQHKIKTLSNELNLTTKENEALKLQINQLKKNPE